MQPCEQGRVTNSVSCTGSAGRGYTCPRLDGEVTSIKVEALLLEGTEAPQDTSVEKKKDTSADRPRN